MAPSPFVEDGCREAAEFGGAGRDIGDDRCRGRGQTDCKALRTAIARGVVRRSQGVRGQGALAHAHIGDGQPGDGADAGGGGSHRWRPLADRADGGRERPAVDGSAGNVRDARWGGRPNIDDLLDRVAVRRIVRVASVGSRHRVGALRSLLGYGATARPCAEARDRAAASLPVIHSDAARRNDSIHSRHSHVVVDAARRAWIGTTRDRHRGTGWIHRLADVVRVTRIVRVAAVGGRHRVRAVRRLLDDGAAGRAGAVAVVGEVRSRAAAAVPIIHTDGARRGDVIHSCHRDVVRDAAALRRTGESCP